VLDHPGLPLLVLPRLKKNFIPGVSTCGLERSLKKKSTLNCHIEG
jgi:hypothetical protein